MGEPHVISALKAKRARIAGEIRQAQDLIAARTKELTTLDAVILMFSPDCDPEMIAPIRPARHGLFFRYRELSRLCVDILRRAKGPMTLDAIVDQVMEAKGLPPDRRLRRHVGDVARAGLLRMARKGLVRRILDQPDQWWEMVR
jgi:hypothetical protein